MMMTSPESFDKMSQNGTQYLNRKSNKLESSRRVRAMQRRWQEVDQEQEQEQQQQQEQEQEQQQQPKEQRLLAAHCRR
jgi:hypothetical protein